VHERRLDPPIRRAIEEPRQPTRRMGGERHPHRTEPYRGLALSSQGTMPGSPAGWRWHRATTDALSRLANPAYAARMPTMNISLPESLRAFVEEQISQRRYGTTSEYVRDLIRRDQDRQHLRSLLLAGAAAEPGPVVDSRYFDELRDEVDLASGG